MSMSNQQVCHAWFHRSPDTGQNGKRSIYYHHDEIYSYGSHFMMARLFMLPQSVGLFDRIVVYTTRSYSPTTTAHQSRVNSAIDRNIAFVANVEDAAKVKTIEQALEALVNTMFDNLHNFEETAKRSAWFNDASLYEIAARSECALKVIKKLYPRSPLIKELKRLVAKTHDQDYIDGIRDIAAKAEARREVERKERARRNALKLIKPIIAGNANMFHDNTVIEAMAQDYTDSPYVTQEIQEQLNKAIAQYLEAVHGHIDAMHEALLTLDMDAYTKWRCPFTGSMDRLRYVNAKHGYKELDDRILSLYDLCLDGAKARYTEDFVDGGLKGDARFEIMLAHLFGLSKHDIMLFVWGGERPVMRDTLTPAPYNANSENYPNCIVWRAPDKGRVRTSMGVEIGLHEFKRFCRIIRALHSGRMTVQDIPEELRKVQGVYTIHRYDKERRFVVVGCHRIAMSNLVALADLICDKEA